MFLQSAMFLSLSKAPIGCAVSKLAMGARAWRNVPVDRLVHLLDRAVDWQRGEEFEIATVLEPEWDSACSADFGVRDQADGQPPVT
jgi:hypothetical protein